MDQSPVGEESNGVETQMSIGLGHVQIVRKDWREPIDRYGRGATHHLEMSLIPPSAISMGCFPDDWGRHRFEPIGEMFMVPAEHTLRARSDCRETKGISCSFDPDAASAWFDGELAWTNARLQGGLDISCGEIRSLLLRLWEEIRTPGFASELMVESIAVQVLVELHRYVAGIDERGSIGGLTPWRLKLIEERLANGPDPSLTELASLCHLSVRHLTRAFRISRGRSIGAYLAQQRMEQAKRMLAAGGGVKTVAHATGFTAASNFATAFRKATGETPRQYRERAAAKPLAKPGRRPARPS